MNSLAPELKSSIFAEWVLHSYDDIRYRRSNDSLSDLSIFLRRSDSCTSPRTISAQARYKLCFGSARINWWSLLKASLNIWSSLEGTVRVQEIFGHCTYRNSLKSLHGELSNTEGQCPRMHLFTQAQCWSSWIFLSNTLLCIHALK